MSEKKEVKELIEDLVKNANTFLGDGDANSLTTEELVSRANRFLDEDDDTFLEELQSSSEVAEKPSDDILENMAVAIRKNTNFNHDATQPYTPAEEFTFHRVEYEDRKGVHSFVCSNYQIKEQMITFYDVRKRTQFHQDEVQPTTTISFNGRWGEPGTMYYEHLYNSDSQFKVDGYTQTDCKTIAREKLSDIDSFTVIPTDDTEWYSLDKKMAQEQSAIKVENYNERIIKEQKTLLTKEHQQRIYEYFVDQHKDSIVRDRKRKYEDKNWFLRLFSVKPSQKTLDALVEDIHTPSDKSMKHYITRYEDSLKEREDLKELYDWSNLIEIFGDDDTPDPKDVHGDVINAEFEEIE